MPIIVSPATLNDGVTAHVLTYQNQDTVKGSIVHTYKNMAMAASTPMTVKAKYDTNAKAVNRSVAQINIGRLDANSSPYLDTINVSAVHGKVTTEADFIKHGTMVAAMLAKADFWKNLYHQM